MAPVSMTSRAPKTNRAITATAILIALAHSRGRDRVRRLRRRADTALIGEGRSKPTTAIATALPGTQAIQAAVWGASRRGLLHDDVKICHGSL
jgi:hypothetical protein